jgi:AIR synthase-related protein
MDPAEFLLQVIDLLRTSPGVRDKVAIHEAYAPALAVAGGVPVGDDCAALPDPATGGYLLLAAEGMLESFVAADPWFAGYSAVMVNLSDVAAMGGRPLAIVDVFWTPGAAVSEAVWAGMTAASQAYGVPIVGGHTTQNSAAGKGYLAAAVLGRTAGPALITSFDAVPGDILLVAVDLNGAYRENKPFWNASTTATPEHLRAGLEILPRLAESGLCATGKDISNGGIIGTLAMLLKCSNIGARLDLQAVPRPAEAGESPAAFARWLSAFPSYGYLLSVKARDVAAVVAEFAREGITCAACGEVVEGTALDLVHGAETARFVEY